MLKRVELQHKVNLCGDEYDVFLDDGSDFHTAFQTLKYSFGKTEKNEKMLIGIEGDIYKNIFKRDGERNIYFYSDNKKFEPKRREFVKSILSKNPTSIINIFICGRAEITLFEANEIFSDILDGDPAPAMICIVIDSNKDTNSVSIVMGA